MSHFWPYVLGALGLALFAIWWRRRSRPSASGGRLEVLHDWVVEYAFEVQLDQGAPFTESSSYTSYAKTQPECLPDWEQRCRMEFDTYSLRYNVVRISLQGTARAIGSTESFNLTAEVTGG